MRVLTATISLSACPRVSGASAFRISSKLNKNGKRVDRWSAYGEPQARQRGQLSGALMGEPFPTYPKLYEEIPKAYYDPLGADRRCSMPMGSTPKCCFPTLPGGSFFEPGDVEFELDVVRAYNDALPSGTDQ